MAGLVILASRPSAGLAVVVATCFAAGFVALSILGAQTARVMNQRGLMIMSSLGQALLPLTWLLAGWLGASAHVANELLAAGAALGCGLLVWHERRRLVSPVAAIRSAEGRTIRSALLLIPHLVLFAAFTQGMRLQAVGHASPERVAAAHDVMLIITIGATLAGSIHAFMTVKIQAAPDGLVDERVRVNAFVYGAMAVVCAVGTVVAMAWLAPHAMSNFPDLGPASVAALALVLPSILTYYALSGLAMRDSRAVVLLVTSATTVAAYYVTASIWPTTSAADASIEYGLSSLVLPLVLFSILMATARGQARGRIVRLSRACAVGYVPALALGVVAWVR
ncbi:hypothetical protein [Cellulomonas alba]|uniref:Uncharacterized protein n=1 Tax=Cellulomonas alba TaxID=3053467 RepID=A0ABT7SH00_9CELL|nr:hypothetical protein [Cellulomonas alba]MDM7855455.1 hypothetical protein [Cellulomonas alba]